MHLRNHTLQFVLPLLLAILSSGIASDAAAETIVLDASKDNNLINDSTGSVSNGTGALFAGRTGGAGPGNLRALLAFDFATDIPAGATITDVELTLTVLQAGNGSDNESYTLHRVDQDWGEGTSNAAGGAGSPSTTNDATWLHTFFDSAVWNTPGGDFNSTPSASTPVGDSGPVTWGSTADLVADVQAWVDGPNSNFGWILIGDETRNASARRFGSRDDISFAPQLSVTYTNTVPEPSSLAIALLGSLGGISLVRRRVC